jgi:hypothetical protein
VPRSESILPKEWRFIYEEWVRELLYLRTAWVERSGVNYGRGVFPIRLAALWLYSMHVRYNGCAFLDPVSTQAILNSDPNVFRSYVFNYRIWYILNRATPYMERLVLFDLPLDRRYVLRPCYIHAFWVQVIYRFEFELKQVEERFHWGEGQPTLLICLHNMRLRFSRFDFFRLVYMRRILIASPTLLNHYLLLYRRWKRFNEIVFYHVKNMVDLSELRVDDTCLICQKFIDVVALSLHDITSVIMGRVNLSIDDPCVVGFHSLIVYHAEWGFFNAEAISRRLQYDRSFFENYKSVYRGWLKLGHYVSKNMLK